MRLGAGSGASRSGVGQGGSPRGRSGKANASCRAPGVRRKSRPFLDTCTKDSKSGGRLSASPRKRYPPGFSAKPSSEISRRCNSGPR